MPLVKRDYVAYPVILCGDQLEYELNKDGADPRERSDWPLPSFDARDWSQAFCKLYPDGPSEDEMIGWFANALMRGYDEGQSRPRKKGTVINAPS